MVHRIKNLDSVISTSLVRPVMGPNGREFGSVDRLLDLLLDYTSDEGVSKRILVENSASLYDFAPVTEFANAAADSDGGAHGK